MHKDNNFDQGFNSFDYGLRSRLLLLLIFMLLPFLVFSTYQAYQGYNQFMKEKRAVNMRDASEIAHNVDELVQSTADLLIAVSKSKPAIEQDFSELKQWFGSVYKKYPYYKNIIYVDLEGNIRAAARTYTKPDGEIIANVKNTQYYKRSLKANGLAYGDFMYAVLSKKPVIHITYPVFGLKHERLGFIAVAFDLSHLQKRIITVNVAEGSDVTVFDQNKTIIARTLDPQNWIGKSFKACDVFQKKQNTLGSITAPGPDGVVRIMSFHNTKLTPWLVAVCFDAAMLRNQAIKEALSQLYLFLPLFFVAVIGWMWIGRDVDRLYKAARRLSVSDPMTGLGSFVKFNKDLAKDIAQAKRQMKSFSLIVINIDNFKEFNQVNGYHYGNRALIKVSDIIQGELRDTDFAYRYGGDEFSLILIDTDELDAMELAERIQGKIRQSVFATRDGRESNLSISIGIATYPLDASDADGLIQCAAEALFEAKKEKSGGITVTYTQTFNAPKKKKDSG